MAKRIHVLSEVNEEDRTAVCAHCGPVDIRYQSGRRPVCGVAKRERAKRAPSYKLSGRKLPHGLTQRQARDFVKDKSCGICGAAGRALVVDHDHSTGEIRDALCYRCNNGLGMFLDDPELLSKAIRYIERFRP